MKNKIKKFLNKPWTSMMVANNIAHVRRGWLSFGCGHYINHTSTLGDVVDCTQCWTETPQGHDYWYNIKYNNLHRGL